MNNLFYVNIKGLVVFSLVEEKRGYLNLVVVFCFVFSLVLLDIFVFRVIGICILLV